MVFDCAQQDLLINLGMHVYKLLMYDLSTSIFYVLMKIKCLKCKIVVNWGIGLQNWQYSGYSVVCYHNFYLSML